MSIMYAVISYDAYTGQEFNIAGWSANEPEARELESRLNDTAELLFGDESATPRVEYHTEAIQLYGRTAEYQPYGDFDALVRNGIFRAIVPAGQGDDHRYLYEGADVVRCMNLLKGLASYLA